MKQKFAIVFLLVFSFATLLTTQINAGVSGSSPFAAAANSKPQIRVQIGGNRGRHRGWYQGRRAYWYDHRIPDRRYRREVYYVNRRPVVRWVWNY